MFETSSIPVISKSLFSNCDMRTTIVDVSSPLDHSALSSFKYILIHAVTSSFTSDQSYPLTNVQHYSIFFSSLTAASTVTTCPIGAIP